MAGSFLISLLAIYSTVYSTSAQINKETVAKINCTHDGFLPHPTNCNAFYWCSMRRSLRAIILECDDEQIFDTQTQSCLYPWLSTRDECGGTLHMSNEVELEAEKPSPAVFRSLGNDCFKEGFVHDENDCTKFYRCVNNGRGKFTKYEFSCDKGTVWDPEINGCNHPWSARTVKCGGRNEVNGLGGASSFRANIGQLTPSNKPKQNNALPIPSKPPIVNNYNNIPEPDNECCEDGFLSNAKDCNKFYRCIEKEKGVFQKLEFSCGLGTVWDYEKEACNPPWMIKNFKCGSGGDIYDNLDQLSRYNQPDIYNPNPGDNPKPDKVVSQPIPFNSGYYQIVDKPFGYNSQQNGIPNDGNNLQPDSTYQIANKPIGYNSQPNGNPNGGNNLQPGSTRNQPPSFIPGYYRTADKSIGNPQLNLQPGSTGNQRVQFLPGYKIVDKTIINNPENTPIDYNLPTESVYKIINKNPKTDINPKPDSESSSNYGSSNNVRNSNYPETSTTTNLVEGTTKNQHIEQSNVICTEDDFVPDPNDCKKFYRCVPNGRQGFIKYEFVCGEGTVWDTEAETCNHPSSTRTKCGTAGQQIPVDQVGSVDNPDTPENSINHQPVDEPNNIIPGGDYQAGTPQLPGQPNDGNTPVQPGYDPDNPNPQPADKPYDNNIPVQPDYQEITNKPSGYPETGNSSPTSSSETFATEKPLQEIDEPINNTTSATAPSSSESSNVPISPDGSQNVTVPQTNTSYPITDLECDADKETFDVCTREGFMADSKDCKKFYRCVNNGITFTKYEFTCGEGTIWDSNYTACIYPHASKRICKNNSTDQNTGQIIPDRKDNTTSTQSTLITSSTVSTETNEFTESSSVIPTGSTPTIVTPDDGDTDNEVICKQEGFMADYKDCKTFYRCVGNEKRGFIKYEFSCGEGTVWDIEQSTCNHPYHTRRQCGDEETEPSFPPGNGNEQNTTDSPSTISSTVTTESGPDSTSYDNNKGQSTTGSSVTISSIGTTENESNLTSEGNKETGTESTIINRSTITTESGSNVTPSDGNKETVLNQTVTESTITIRPTVSTATVSSVTPDNKEVETESTITIKPTITTESGSNITPDDNNKETIPNQTGTESTTVIRPTVTTESGSNFTPDNKETVPDLTSPESVDNAEQCKRDGFMADSKDCQIFYRCVKQRNIFIKYEFKCGDGTVWDSDLDTCNHPSAVRNNRCNTGIYTPPPQISEHSTVLPVGSTAPGEVPMPESDLGTTIKPTEEPEIIVTASEPGSVATEETTPTKTESGQGTTPTNTESGQETTTTKTESGQETTLTTTESGQETTPTNTESGQETTTIKIESGQQTTPITTESGQETTPTNTESGQETTPITTGSGQETTPTKTESGQETTPSTTVSGSSGEQGTDDPIGGFTTVQTTPSTTEPKPSSEPGSSSEPSTVNSTEPNQPGTQTQSGITSGTTTSPPQITTQPTVSTTTDVKPFLTTENNCVKQGFFTNREDCSKFYRCVSSGNGFMKYDFACGPGTIWDPDLNTCNHPYAVKNKMCKEVSQQTTERPHTDVTPSGEQTIKPETEKPVSPPESGSHEIEDKCTGEGFYPNSQDCKKFFRCVSYGGDKYVKFDFSCGEGTIFDPNIQSCNHPYASENRACGHTSGIKSTTDKDIRTDVPLVETTTSVEITSTEDSETTTISEQGTTEVEKEINATTPIDETTTVTEQPSETTTFGETTTVTEQPSEITTFGETTTDSKQQNETTTSQETTPEVTTTESEQTTETTSMPTTEQTETTPLAGSTESIQQNETTTEGEQQTDTTPQETTSITGSTDSEQTTGTTSSGETTITDSVTTSSPETTTQGEQQTETTPVPTTTQTETTSPEESTTSVLTTTETEQQTTDDTTTTEVATESTTVPDDNQETTTATTVVTTDSEQLSTTENREITTTETVELTTKEEISTLPNESTTADIIETTGSTTTDMEQLITKPELNQTAMCPISELEGDQIALVCPTGFKRHPKYCNMFYQCTSDTDSLEIKILVLSCSMGTIYDDEKIQCLAPEMSNQKCEGDIKHTAQFRTSMRSKLPMEIESVKPLCPTTGSYSLNPQKCATNFIKCELSPTNDRKMRAYIHQCPTGFTYWPISKQCELLSTAEAVGCVDQEQKEEPLDDQSEWMIPVEVQNVSTRRLIIKK